VALLNTLLAFLVAIGLLVTIHELGHYWAARLCNVKILRFSVGFGRTIWMRRFGPDQTEWAVAVLPLGGFVKMADERDESVEPQDRARAFNNKPIWQRMVIIAAGPMANFVLAALLYWIVFVAGQPGALPFVASPPTDSAAANAGFVEYDRIIAVDGHAVSTWNDVRMLLLERAAARTNTQIRVETRGATQAERNLSMAGIQKADLDRDFAAALGLNPYRLPIAPVIETVADGSAAAQAGLKPGDRVVAVNGRAIAHWRELVEVIVRHPGKPVALTVESRGELYDANVTPVSVTEKGNTIGRIGVLPVVDRAAAASLFTTVRSGPLEAIGKSINKVWEMSVFSVKMLWRMLSGDISWKNLSGPITIADYAGQSLTLGWLSYLTFLALISISIGVLNLLPIPVLDGGQLLYHIAELIKGSPLSEQAIDIGQRIGFALLLGLTAFAFYNDIHRLVSS
jgi:regulator of sigma E protease